MKLRIIVLMEIVLTFTICGSLYADACPYSDYNRYCEYNNNRYCCESPGSCQELIEQDKCIDAMCSFNTIYVDDSKEVELLRAFRDEVLSKTPLGQEIIKLYYQWSPAIVQAMEKDEEFKEEVKEMIDGVFGLVGGEME